MKLKIATAAVVLVGACGSNDSGGMCQEADGSYDLKVHEVSGDCDVGDSLSVIALGSAASDEDATTCTGNEQASDDGCTLSVDERCDLQDPATGDNLGVFRQTGQLKANESGSRMTGRATYTYAYNDGSSCSSTVDLTFTRR